MHANVVCVQCGQGDGGLPTLNFHRAVFSDVMNDNGLLVLARGLGLRTVVSKLLRLFSTPSNLVFVLNASSDAEWYTSALQRDGACVW